MWTEPPPEGYITDVSDGWVSGRVFIYGEVCAFDMKLEDVLECQRGYIEPGAYVSFPNAHLLVNKTIWTTHDVETAKAEGARRFKALGWDRPSHSNGVRE